MVPPGQVETLATVKALAGFERRYPRARRRSRLVLVVKHDQAMLDRDCRGIRDEDAFEVCVLDFEIAHHDVAQAGIVDSVYIDAVGKSGRIDDRFFLTP